MPIPEWLVGNRAGDLFVEHMLTIGIELSLTPAEYRRQLERLADRWHGDYLTTDGEWLIERTGGQPYTPGYYPTL